MNDSTQEPEIVEVLSLIHGDVTHLSAPDVFVEAFWRILESESKTARLLSIVRDLELKRSDINREDILARAQQLGLSAIPTGDLAAIATDAALLEAVVKRIYPDVEEVHKSPTHITSVKLVDRKGRRYSAAIRRAVSPDGRSGWILDAMGIPSGELDVAVIKRGMSLLRPQCVATVRIPAALTDVAITSGALAGKEDSETHDDPHVTYQRFQDVLDEVGSDRSLAGELEGYVVPQQKGARIVAFIAEDMCHDMGDSP